MASSIFFNVLIIGVAVVAVFLLSARKLRKSLNWQATLTPLSSIIGSGFLIMPPLLVSITGVLSPLAALMIVVLAYGIGHVVRFNILHVEPRIENGTLSHGTQKIEYLGNTILVVAYLVAIAFYLSLLSAFLLEYLDYVDPVLTRLLTSVIIMMIMIVGWAKGLGGLEKIESLSMTFQLAIVAALLVALLVFGWYFLDNGQMLALDYQKRPNVTQIQMLAGALLVVQGFETSRFLGTKYSPEVRISSMRRAQIISGVIYIASVVLFLPLMAKMNLMDVALAEMIKVVGVVAVVLPTMLIFATLLSQLSAAVADTGGGGGLVHEQSGGRVSVNLGYVGVSLGAVALVWAADLLEIISLASRAFAAYYLFQTLLALFYCFKDCPGDSHFTVAQKAFYMTIAAVLIYVVIFAIPAE